METLREASETRSFQVQASAKRQGASPHEGGEGAGPSGLCNGKRQEVKGTWGDYRQMFSKLQSCASKPLSEEGLRVTAGCVSLLLSMAPGTYPSMLSGHPRHRNCVSRHHCRSPKISVRCWWVTPSGVTEWG